MIPITSKYKIQKLFLILYHSDLYFQYIVAHVSMSYWNTKNSMCQCVRFPLSLTLTWEFSYSSSYLFARRKGGKEKTDTYLNPSVFLLVREVVRLVMLKNNFQIIHVSWQGLGTPTFLDVLCLGRKFTEIKSASQFWIYYVFCIQNLSLFLLLLINWMIFLPN